jgi:enoyl-CoA hydratase
MLYELDDAFVALMQDSDVKVVILAADGPDFSSGHDLTPDPAEQPARGPIIATGGFDQPGQHGHMAREEDVFVGLCWRWRNLPKPTIAQVQGRVIGPGLMLLWPLDLVIAAEGATFNDQGPAFGVGGCEYFVHAWEFGPRKAKELLFTGGTLTARQCEALGMINHVVPDAELEEFTLDLARQITTRPAFALKLAKLAVNQSLDAQGQYTAIQHAFALHQLGHANSALVHGYPSEPDAAAMIRGERERS